ncbi:hypothetical protein GCM10008967_09660 [Bacillus carboniphilus]|uniref:ATP-grasp domain-containing protein n=1 Tax=Bacillus carboniphilus TaxID=86663 RepID=A0ABN0VZL0_9BACI
MRKPIIGVLTWRDGFRFKEPAYFRQLGLEGQALGVILYFFSPADVDFGSNQVSGVYLKEDGSWASKWFMRPDIVIDRFRFTTDPAFKEYVALRKASGFSYANNRLGNKWKVHRALMKNEVLHKWLPKTVLYSRVQLLQMLESDSVVYVKPVNGTGGRGIMKISKDTDGYYVLGRNHVREIFNTKQSSFTALSKFLEQHLSKGKHIIQQGLSLNLIKDRAVDMRILIQKNGNGEWDITGSGMRVGSHHSATSNLHGGGKSNPPQDLLMKCFTLEKTQAILADCRRLAYATAQTVEEQFGRMIELGLDVGVEINGRCWLIEVNPKPGREIFMKLGELSTYREAVRRPLEYCLFLLQTFRS